MTKIMVSSYFLNQAVELTFLRTYILLSIILAYKDVLLECERVKQSERITQSYSLSTNLELITINQTLITSRGALGVGAIAANTPTLGAGSSTGGFGTPGQGGGSTGSGMGGEGTPVAGMYFFHNDQIGSTRLMTDASGELVAGSNGATDIVYNPYGDLDVDHSHGPDILRNKFTGQQLDNESGLYYYNARYYDPALGRFISADPLLDAGGSPSGMDPYMYVSGNPVRFNDPTGHKQKGYGAKMLQDFKNAAFSYIATYGTPETKLAFMAYGKEIRRQKAKEEKRKENLELAVNIVLIVIVVVASVYSGGTAGAALSNTATISAANSSAASITWGAVMSDIAAGIAVDVGLKATGALVGGYTSNGSHSWDSKGAQRGMEIGGYVSTIVSLYQLGKGLMKTTENLVAVNHRLATDANFANQAAMDLSWSTASPAFSGRTVAEMYQGHFYRAMLKNIISNSALAVGGLVPSNRAAESLLKYTFRHHDKTKPYEAWQEYTGEDSFP